MIDLQHHEKVSVRLLEATRAWSEPNAIKLRPSISFTVDSAIDDLGVQHSGGTKSIDLLPECARFNAWAVFLYVWIICRLPFSVRSWPLFGPLVKYSVYPDQGLCPVDPNQAATTSFIRSAVDSSDNTVHNKNERVGWYVCLTKINTVGTIFLISIFFLIGQLCGNDVRSANWVMFIGSNRPVSTRGITAPVCN